MQGAAGSVHTDGGSVHSLGHARGCHRKGEGHWLPGDGCACERLGAGSSSVCDASGCELYRLWLANRGCPAAGWQARAVAAGFISLRGSEEGGLEGLDSSRQPQKHWAEDCYDCGALPDSCWLIRASSDRARSASASASPFHVCSSAYRFRKRNIDGVTRWSKVAL